MKRFFVPVFALSILLANQVFAWQDDAAEEEHGHHEGWTVSLKEATSTAAAEEKDILMEFTGSDWCPPCKALYKNVISTDYFAQEAPQDFVLLLLDSPRDKSHQTEAEIAQYKELSGKYNIEGVPTIILSDTKGRPYAKMVGYSGDSPEKYVETLQGHKDKRVARDAAFAKAENATGAERAKFLDEALMAVDPDNSNSEMLFSFYGDTIAEIISLGDDSSELTTKYVSMRKSAELKSKIAELKSQASPDNLDDTIEGLKQLIADEKPEGAMLQDLWFTIGGFAYGTDKEASKEALLKAVEADPTSDLAERIKSQILPQAFPEDDKSDDKDDGESDN